MRMFLRLCFLLCLSLPLKASFISDEEFVGWLNQARHYDAQDATYVEENYFDKDAMMSYLTTVRTDQKIPDGILEEAQKLIVAHSEVLVHTNCLFAPWNNLFGVVLVGLTDYKPRIHWPELAALAYVRGIPGAQVLAERLGGIEGLNIEMTALSLGTQNP